MAAPRLGIDVGGTNTDAVIMSGREVVTSAKRLTTPDITEGVMSAVHAVLEASGLRAEQLADVMIGTTQFINAFVQRRGLSQVAAVRVSLPKTDGIPPMTAWPQDLLDVIGRANYLVAGGSFFDGKEYEPLDEAQLALAARDIKARAIRSVAVTSNFAPVRPDIEQRAASIIRNTYPEADITLSSEVGGLGLVDRENAAIINASLRGLSRVVVTALRKAFLDIGISAPVYVTQNDGTLLSTDTAARFPVFTCSAGPTNSIRGAAFLTGMNDAVVVDIGGTTSDFGFLVRGFPRETATAHAIGGVRTNFRMPDVLSIALGGGTLVRVDEGRVQLGPESVGYEIGRRALVFGGTELTTTDVAVRAGLANVGDPARVRHLDPTLISVVLDAIEYRVVETIERMKTNSTPVPVILVGGGHILLGRPGQGLADVHRPKHADVANAVGAAIALASGRIDKIYDFGSLGRERALTLAKQEACTAARAAGAKEETIEIVEIVELPMTHMKSGAVQVKVRAVGEVAAVRCSGSSEQ